MNDKPAPSPEKDKSEELPETGDEAAAAKPEQEPEQKAADAAEPEQAAAGKAQRKKPKKTTMLTVLVGAAILVLAVMVMFNTEDLTKIYIEQLASRTLNVEVTIGDLSFNPEERKVTIRNILVANPEGFVKPAALSVDTMTVSVESLAPDRLIIASAVADHARVMLETHQGRANLMVLRRNMNRIAAAEAEGKPDEKAERPPISVAVRLAEITNTTLHISLNGNDLRPMVLPALQVTDIGGEQGALASQAIGQLMDQIAAHVFAAALEAGYLNSALDSETLAEIKASLGLDYLGQAREAIDSWSSGVREFIEERRR